MDNRRLAGELERIARMIKADYNDVAMYINLYDIISGKDLLTPENGVLHRQFEDAVDTYWKNNVSSIKQEIKKILKKDKKFMQELEDQGGSLK